MERQGENSKPHYQAQSKSSRPDIFRMNKLKWNPTVDKFILLNIFCRKNKISKLLEGCVKLRKLAEMKLEQS